MPWLFDLSSSHSSAVFTCRKYLKMATEGNVLMEAGARAKLETTSLSVSERSADSRKEKIYGALFLGAVTGISALIGFGTTFAAARKKDPRFFEEGVVGVKGASESGASLALRALGWGSVYAIGGCGIFVYGIWKLSGANNFDEFRHKMGSVLPRIPKNNPPKSRTEFEGLTDLLTYVSRDWGKETSEGNE